MRFFFFLIFAVAFVAGLVRTFLDPIAVVDLAIGGVMFVAATMLFTPAEVQCDRAK